MRRPISKHYYYRCHGNSQQWWTRICIFIFHHVELLSPMICSVDLILTINRAIFWRLRQNKENTTSKASLFSDIRPFMMDVNGLFSPFSNISESHFRKWKCGRGGSGFTSWNLKEMPQRTFVKCPFHGVITASRKPGPRAAANQQTPTSASGCGLVHLDGMTAALQWASQ